ncbi:glutathione S-transferase family protein [Corallococcus sp. H22C18031201]|uniref:glutathione S-transferase family protein n=1 Tax=Citreicoccus inhibens TaxID=2849499 RepID=UPI000E74A77D|nr:glutathione S-transferase family protein [Citreicoccus inhibens]MBU8899718.1 glutathione S-transferase family protein [Citreicoccus inhibens]RJS18361.1 glutathione S-transferase family protein [Corallococcus sp. H22C18031201]
MKLYFAPRSRATRVRWLLEEIGVPYELARIDLSKKENLSPDYLAIHPLGELPALVDGDLTLLGPMACCLHLTDMFPEKALAPRLGSPERALYYQWLAFVDGVLEPAVLEFYWDAQSSEAPSVGPRSSEELANRQERMVKVLDMIVAGLGGRENIVGTTFTTADIALASILHLANRLMLLTQHPLLVAYVMRHCQGPAVRRAVM